MRLAHVLANIMAPLSSPTAEPPTTGPAKISLSLRHQTHIGVPPDYDPLYEYHRAAYQPKAHLPHSAVQATPDLHVLQSLHLTDKHRLSLPDYIPPSAFVHHLEESLLARRPIVDANSYCALSMDLASHVESLTRRRLAVGVNRLGAQVDHLNGLLHTDPPLRSCQSCSRPVTQLYLCSRSLPVTAQHTGPAPINHAASETLLTSVFHNAQSREPALISDYRPLNPYYSLAETSFRAHLSHTDDTAHLCYSCARAAMRYSRRHTAPPTAGPLSLSDGSCDLLDYRSVFQTRQPALPPVPSDISPPTLDPYARDAWRGTALLSNDYVFVAVTALPDANDRSVVNILARLLGDADDSPPLAPPANIDDTSRCALFSISDAREASDTFEASGLTAAWSAALSLPALGPPTMESTPALELLAKRNALRTRNRDLTGLTAESSPPPSPKRRARAQSLPMASPHMVPDTAPPPSPPLADDDSDFDDSLPPDSPADGVSVADSFVSSASLDIDFSMLFSTSAIEADATQPQRKRIRSKRRVSHRKRPP